MYGHSPGPLNHDIGFWGRRLVSSSGTSENGNRAVSSGEQELRNKLRKRIRLLERFIYCNGQGLLELKHLAQGRFVFSRNKTAKTMEVYEQHDSHPPPQHLFCPQPQQLGPHYGGPASGIWYERCRRAGHEAKMSAARIRLSPPPYSGSHSYRAKPFVRHYSGGDSTALWQQRQQSRPFCSFG